MLRSKFNFGLYIDCKQKGESQLPAGHPVPPSAQAGASKCPFLAAEMGQKNSSVVRQVSMEFQEDVQEVRTVQKGKGRLRNSRSNMHVNVLTYVSFFFSFAPLVHFTEVSSAQLKKPSLAAPHRGRSDQGTSLINSLLTQRPKRVSHLLKDNFPTNRECCWCPFRNAALWQAVAPEPAAPFPTAVVVRQVLFLFRSVSLQLRRVPRGEDRREEERPHLPRLQNGQPPGQRVPHGG